MAAKKVQITISDLNNKPATVTFKIDRPNDLIQSKICSSNDFYERQLLDVIGNITPPNSVFIDIGANIGNHTLFMAAKTQARVFAFEPNKKNYYRLERNIKLSKLTANVESHNIAIGKKTATVRSVILSHENTGSAIVQQTTENDKNGVDLVRLDDFLAVNPVIFGGELVVKIDVEGMEVDVLEGMINTIEKYKPVIICEASSDKNTVLIRNILLPRGYMVAASFFKSPTFLIAHRDKIKNISAHIEHHSWITARNYVSYCELSSLRVRAQKAIFEAAQILK